MENEELRTCKLCGKEFDKTELFVGPYCSRCDHNQGQVFDDLAIELGLKKRETQ